MGLYLNIGPFPWTLPHIDDDFLDLWDSLLDLYFCLTFDINDNLIQQYPPLSLMKILTLPLSSCSFLYLPLWHQWKRELPLMLSLPLFTCCTRSHANPIGERITPNLCLIYSKVSLGRGLVKISSTCSFVPMYSSMMFFFFTYSLRKWNLIVICFVLECITRFLEMFIALVLS